MAPSRRLPSALACAVLVLLGLSTACDSGAAPVPPSATSEGGKLATTSPLALIAGSQARTLFQGVRRYETRWSDDTGAHVLEYRERASSDGQGGYAVEFLDLLQPQVSTAEQARFALQQEQRAGLVFRYRDFDVRDLDAFSAKYLAQVTGQQVQIAGQVAERLLVQAQVQPDRRWIVDYLPQNGLLLRAREELLNGTLVSLIEYESVDLTPDLSGVALGQLGSGEVLLPPGQLAASQTLGFQPRQPKQVPDTWRQLEFVQLPDPLDGRSWAKTTYTDGIEVLFFVEKAPPPPGHVPISSGPAGPDRVTLLRIGAWKALEGKVSGRQVVVLGKLDDVALADLIRSAYP